MCVSEICGNEYVNVNKSKCEYVNEDVCEWVSPKAFECVHCKYV